MKVALDIHLVFTQCSDNIHPIFTFSSRANESAVLLLKDFLTETHHKLPSKNLLVRYNILMCSLLQVLIWGCFCLPGRVTDVSCGSIHLSNADKAYIPRACLQNARGAAARDLGWKRGEASRGIPAAGYDDRDNEACQVK
jgi:hypothetical protein